MLFENATIHPDQLPIVESSPLQGLQKSYLKVSIISTLLFFMLLLGFITVLLTITKSWGKAYWPYLAYGTWLILFMINLFVVYKEFNIKSYAIRERDIIYRSGLFWQSLVTVPFNRVQHCDVAQGPIDRLFGLSSLNIYTAGGNSSDLSIPGLLPETAQKLKSFIIKKTAAIDEEE